MGKSFTKGESSQGLCLFHEFDEAIWEAIVKIALKDAPKTCTQHRNELESHATACRIKKELIKTEVHIDALYYHKMYHSDGCWKGSPRVVSRELKNVMSEATKSTAIKENTKMHAKGLYWDW